MSNILFSRFSLGRIELSNRIVMAPMTRCRAASNVPNDLMVTYYTQRASAGLIITEGTAPSPNGLGYLSIPGCYSDEQVAGWKRVTDAVHAAGGHIFLQMMHTGRVSHPDNMPAGAEVVAPSPVAAPGEMFTLARGMQPHPVPREMTHADIDQAVEEFAHCASHAIRAGFDGVEIHGANGYLVEQFLNPASNHRTDGYGGSIEGRNRFAIEVAGAVASAIGEERVGIRLSPYGVFNGSIIHDELDAQYGALASTLGRIGLAYVHMVDHSSMGAPAVPDAVKAMVRERFGRTYIASGGYDAARATADLEAGKAQLVAFARPFIANPDLVARLRSGAELAQPNPAQFYSPGPEGYIDWPTL